MHSGWVDGGVLMGPDLLFLINNTKFYFFRCPSHNCPAVLRCAWSWKRKIHLSATNSTTEKFCAWNCILHIKNWFLNKKYSLKKGHCGRKIMRTFAYTWNKTEAKETRHNPRFTVVFPCESFTRGTPIDSLWRWEYKRLHFSLFLSNIFSQHKSLQYLREPENW